MISLANQLPLKLIDKKRCENLLPIRLQRWGYRHFSIEQIEILIIDGNNAAGLRNQAMVIYHLLLQIFTRTPYPPLPQDQSKLVVLGKLEPSLGDRLCIGQWKRVGMQRKMMHHLFQLWLQVICEPFSVVISCQLTISL